MRWQQCQPPDPLPKSLSASHPCKPTAIICSRPLHLAGRSRSRQSNKDVNIMMGSSATFDDDDFDSASVTSAITGATLASTVDQVKIGDLEQQLQKLQVREKLMKVMFSKY